MGHKGFLFDIPLTRMADSWGMTTDPPASARARSETSDYGRYMHFGVLGTIEATDSRRRLSVGGPKQRTVLALLISRAGNTVSTDSLVDGVYGDEAPHGARRSIQTYVSNLRSEFGDVIEATGSGYVLKADRSEVDAFRFEDAISEASALDDPEQASEILRDALALWRGHPYADVDGLFELTSERTRLSELRISAIGARVDTDLERGHHRQLIAELDSLTEEHPLRERFRAQQMLALYRCGRQAEALRAYERTRTYLVDEMGLDPSPDLRELEQRILDQDPSLGFETGPKVQYASILVADIADPRILPTLDPTERYNVVTHQADAIREAAEEHGGDLFAHRASAIYVSFEDVENAVVAAVATQQTLLEHDEGMRMAISVGEVEVPQDEVVQGPPVTRAARLVSAAHGGQILLSSEANQALADSGGAGWVVRSLGQHDVDGSGEDRPVYQLMIDGLERDFPPLRSELLPLPLPVASRGLRGYELREEIGSGAFGVVHRAYQPSVGREVAIKIVRPEFANDPQFIRRFEVEAQLVARLEHPHIVPLHDYWRNPDGAYLVMRWLGGGTLKDEIASSRLSIDEAHGLLADIGPALAFAHRRGVVHRDIKLSNVLLDDEGGAYLTDFGIASDIALHGVGSVSQDVQALAVLLHQCVGETDEPAVTELLSTAATTQAFSDVRSFIAAWEEAAGAGDSMSQAVGYTPTRNPYKGLSAFGELDADDFHGRDAEVSEIVTTLASHPLVAVVGPSGIGKSSVVRAGMIPALRSGSIPGSDRWLITDMLPGAYPYEELASALMRVATEMPSDLEDDLRRDGRGLARSVKRYVPEGQTVLLIVDQFEELFTLSSTEERASFLEMLAATISDERSNVRIIITMRADFFDRPLRFADLGDALRAGTIPISAPTDEGLHAIVAAPAAGVGVSFEPGLIDRIVADVKHQPGALPLLEFSLTELFDQRDSDLLILDAYAATGGVLGALGRRTEATYANLDEQGQQAARETFQRLVNVSEAGRDTRRRVRLTELERLGLSGVVLRDMLNAFGDHRLLTFDRDPITRGPTVEVAHEAILTEWPRLTSWIDEHREDLLLRSRLAAAVADWDAADCSETYLLARGRLDQHEAWTADTDLTLTTAEEEFLAASRSAENRRMAQRRRTRRLVMSGFGMAALIAAILAITAFMARNDTAEQAALAKQNQRTAETNQALAEANASDAKKNASVANQKSEEALRAAATAQLRQASIQSKTDPELATLLALTTAQNGNVDDEQLARILHLAVQNWNLGARHHPGTFGVGASIGIDRTGRYTSGFTESGDIVLLDHVDQRQPIVAESWTPPAPINVSNPPRFVPNEDGTEVASVGDDGTLRVWSVGSTDPVVEIPLIDGPQGIPNSGWVQEKWITFEPEGDRAAVVTWTDIGGRAADLHIVDLRLGTVLSSTTMWEPFWIEWRPDGQLAVLIRFNEGGMYLFDPLDLPEVDYQGIPVDPEANIIVATELHAHEGAMSKDGQTIAIGTLQGFIIADTATGEARIGPLDLGGPIGSVEFSPDERLVAVGITTGEITVLEVATGNQVAEFNGPNIYLNWAVDGSTLGAIDVDGGGLVWDATGKPSGELWSRDLGDILVTRFAASEDRMAVMTRENPSRSGPMFVLDSLTGAVLQEHPDHWGYGVMFTPDGSKILSQSGGIDNTDNYWLSPFQGLDRRGDISITYGAPCPEYYEQDCADDPDFFWLFSVSGAMSPAGDVFASGYQTMATWDVDSGAHLATSAEEVGFLVIAGFSTEGELIVFVEQPDESFELTWFDPYTLDPLRSTPVTEFYNISPDGSILISWATDHHGETSDNPLVQVHTLRDGHTGEISGSIETKSGGQPFFSPSGARLGIFDHENEITIWNTATLTLEQTIPLAAQYDDAMWLDETTIAMLYADGAIVALTTETQDLISSARQKVTRTLTSVECRDFDIDPCPTLEELRRN